MEDLEPEVIEELKKKAIEREVTEIVEEQPELVQASETAEKPVEEKPKPQVSVAKKSKKVRSAAQIAAFEKAKLKRAENLRLKKEQKEKDKLNKKEEKKIIKEKVKEELSKPSVRQETTTPMAIQQPSFNSSNPREQVIQNHYYYYGVPPPNHYEKPKKKKSKKKQIVEPSSSSSEEEEEYSNSPIQHPYRPPSPPIEPQSYKELQNYQEERYTPAPQKAHPKLKFAFA